MANDLPAVPERFFCQTNRLGLGPELGKLICSMAARSTQSYRRLACRAHGNMADIHQDTMYDDPPPGSVEEQIVNSYASLQARVTTAAARSENLQYDIAPPERRCPTCPMSGVIDGELAAVALQASPCRLAIEQRKQ